MYNPGDRLHAFYPLQAPQSVPQSIFLEKKTRRTSKVKVIAHAVTLDEYTVEKRASTDTVRVAFGTAKDEKQAKTYAAIFGSGNLIVLAVSDASAYDPHLLAIGVTTGCEIDGKAVRGTWTVIAEPNPCPFTPENLHFESSRLEFLHWDICPRHPIMLQRNAFAKVLLTDVKLVNKASRDLIEKTQKAGRMAALIKYMLTFSKDCAEGVLHEMGVCL